MNRIDVTFEKLKKNNEMAFIPYITAGDFGLDTTKKLIQTIENSGADLIEVGIPYSDPVADGPVIERASARTLESGIKMEQIFNMVHRVRNNISIPILFMMYFNCILKYGPELFAQKCSDIGIDGVIVPDLPFEEAHDIKDIFESRGIYLIHFIAPTSDERIEKIVKDAKGFLYCVSSTGVTGERKEFSKDLFKMLEKVDTLSKVPRAVGFGISNPEQINKLKGHCEATIVGTAMVKIIEEFGATDKLYSKVENFVKSMKNF